MRQFLIIIIGLLYFSPQLSHAFSLAQNITGLDGKTLPAEFIIVDGNKYEKMGNVKIAANQHKSVSYEQNERVSDSVFYFNSGCNTRDVLFFSKGEPKFLVQGTTDMYCTKEKFSSEELPNDALYSKALKLITRYAIKNYRLSFYDSQDNIIMSFIIP